MSTRPDASEREQVFIACPSCGWFGKVTAGGGPDASERERVPTVEELLDDARSFTGDPADVVLANQLHAALDELSIEHTAVKLLLAEKKAALARVAELEPLVCIHSMTPDETQAELSRLRAGLREIASELDMAEEGYPACVSNAAQIASRLLGDE